MGLVQNRVDTAAVPHWQSLSAVIAIEFLAIFMGYTLIYTVILGD